MCYVGSSVDIGTRIGQHLWDATGRNSTTLIHKAIREFGAESFDVELLRECKKEDLLKEEQFYIALLDGASVNGFNISSTPSSGWRGLKASDATLARRSASMRGKKRSPEFIAGAILRSTGKKHTEETKAKISATKKAAVTPEIRERAASIWRGKKMPREDVERRAASATGGKRTEAFKQAQRERSTGKRHSQETVEKIRAIKTGGSHTAESRLKMSASRLGKKRGPYRAGTGEAISKAKLEASARKRAALMAAQLPADFGKVGIRVADPLPPPTADFRGLPDSDLALMACEI